MNETPEKDLFDDAEAEILEGPTLDDKLDIIIDLLKKNEKEHQEIRDELKEIKDDQRLLRAAYLEHGKMLGEHGSMLGQIMVGVNGHNKERP